MVFGHQGQGSATNNFHAIHSAPQSQHFAKLRVIRRGAYQTTTARREARWLQILTGLWVVYQAQRLVPRALIIRRKPLNLFFWHPKGGVLHTQGFENSLL